MPLFDYSIPSTFLLSPSHLCLSCVSVLSIFLLLLLSQCLQLGQSARSSETQEKKVYQGLRNFFRKLSILQLTLLELQSKIKTGWLQIHRNFIFTTNLAVCMLSSKFKTKLCTLMSYYGPSIKSVFPLSRKNRNFSLEHFVQVAFS